MNKILFLFSIFVLSANFSGAQAQKNPFERLQIGFGLQQPPKTAPNLRDSQIKNIQNFGDASGIAYTNDTLFRTDDNGETWRELALPLGISGKISAVRFENNANGFAVYRLSGNAQIYLAETSDGGENWTTAPIVVRNEDADETDFETAEIEILSHGELKIAFRVPTSSNFEGKVFYISANNRKDWNFGEKVVEIRRSDEASDKFVSENWTLQRRGNCANGKLGCVQETALFANGKEITPSKIKELTRIEKDKAAAEARNSVFAAPPGGSTRISLNRGFDKCTAGTIAQMQTWWDNSPHYDANIYLSGRNRGCTQAQLTANWVNQVSAMGWGLIPTIVGYQSPCTASTTSAKLSYDVALAEQQGRGEADIAITDANNLGLTQGTVLYYDMERYDETASTPGCRAATVAFLKGWTDRVKELGYISGTYGSPTNAVADWVNIPAASRMDAVWLARWDNNPSVWSYASPSPAVPTNVWNNHQRIKQWQAPHNETWGGVTFNIDGNQADGPVAGLAIPKNKTADFDGDGKTDVSVFRPDAGSWYVLRSANSSFFGVAFGNANDIIAPADYDGDGKTDTAVFRPSEGNWYVLSKANTFSSRNFGQNGDIPVAADYNGDGKADYGVFRPSNGTWYIANSDSLATFTIVQFGANGDKPVPADFDGDGKTDIAVWRESAGDWYVLRSATNSFYGLNFGQTGDKTAHGDFDADGKTDFAVYRGGTWFLQQSTAGFSSISFGTSEDLPVTGDYDGDNKADIAVYRPSAGTWYILQSTSGFTAYGFGNATDKPVPAAYLGQ